MSGFSRFLSGVTVIDLSQYLPGPMATLFLSDMGATVIKIEPPGGDPMQEAGPRDAAGRPVFYHSLNGGKTIVRLDLKSEAGRDRFMRLLTGADVVVEGFRPGVMDRLGLGYEALKAARPDIVLCSISGYGIGAGLAGKAGHDGNYLALAGAMARNGGAGATGFYDPPLADGAGALFAALTILGALHGRREGRGGCHIDLALADVVMPLQMMQIAGYGATGAAPRGNDTYLNGGAAYYNSYATADGGSVMLGAMEPKFWRNFCLAAERPDWVERHGEPLPQDALKADLRTFFAGLTRAACKARFEASDCCLTVVLGLDEALAHPHTAERGFVAEDREGLLQTAFPVRIDGQAQPVREPPVFLDGADLDEMRAAFPPPDRKQGT